MSLDKRKCDPELGLRVQKYLESIGMDTPTKPDQVHISGTVGEYRPLSVKERIAQIETHMKDIMTVLGLDLSDDSMCDTPNRVAKMYVAELFYGLDTDTFPKCTVVDNKMQYDEMVMEKSINVTSFCEHHFQPITGSATIAYIPNEKVLGLSKLNRVTDYFCRRPQVQERLTGQIFHALQFILETENVAVLIDAEHGCVKNRGIQDYHSHTVTSKLGGAFKDDPATRAEFMSLAKGA
jgi:GTP cyclohydrolase I